MIGIDKDAKNDMDQYNLKMHVSVHRAEQRSQLCRCNPVGHTQMREQVCVFMEVGI